MALTMTLNLQNLPERQKQQPVFANHEFGKTAEKLEPKREQTQLTEEKEAEESAQKEKERTDKSIGITHLITSYAKARTLVSLCRDFDTPLFGDLPGNEAEKTIMKNLAHFLKDETNKMKFVNCGEEQEKTTFQNEDPTMQASLSVIAATISELEKKKRKLEGDKREFENVDKVVKGFTGELEENIKQATTLKTEVEAHNVRLERLKERQKNERKNNDSERSQFHKEMEEINKIHVHSLQENLRTLQEKIGEETKGFSDVKRELKNLKERNDRLRTRIKEVETINNNLKKILAKSTKVGNTGGQNTGSLSVKTHYNINQ